jgi:cell division transport system permease protein
MTRIDEQRPLVDLGNERPQVRRPARILSPIVPRASISGRALVAVVAIMTFLASITTGAVLLVSASRRNGSPMSPAKSPSARPVAGAQPRYRRRGGRDAGPAATRSAFQQGQIGQAARAVARTGLARQRPVPRVIVARVQPGTALGAGCARDARCASPASTITVPGSSACAR